MERKIGESITLQAVPNFRWQEEVPYVDPVTKEEKTKLVERKVDFGTLKFLTVPDDVTRLAMLETGELDLISDILPHNVKRLKRNKHIKIKRATTAPSLYALAARADNYPIFKDAEFSLSHQRHSQCGFGGRNNTELHQRRGGYHQAAAA